MRKEEDRKIAKFLEEVSRNINARSASEVLRVIIKQFMELKEKFSEFEKYREKITELESELNTCRTRVQEYEDKIRELLQYKNKAAELESRLSELKRENEILREEYKKLLNEVVQELEKLKRENKELKEKLSLLETDSIEVEVLIRWERRRVRVTGPKIIIDLIRKANSDYNYRSYLGVILDIIVATLLDKGIINVQLL